MQEEDICKTEEEMREAEGEEGRWGELELENFILHGL